MLLLLPYWFVQ